MSRINLICLGVRDIVKSRAFYRDVLSFSTPNDEDSPQVVFFDNQGTKLELYPLDKLAEDIDEKNPPRPGGGFGGMTLAYSAKSRAEVDEIFLKLEAAHVKIAKRPQEAFWGGYSGYFQDPDGYYWEVGYANLWRFDENDMLIVE